MRVELTDEELAKEEWRPVKDYEGLYEVSNMGRVRSLDHNVYKNNRFNSSIWHINGRILKIGYNKLGYGSVRLSRPIKGCDYQHRLVHRLVAEAFIPNTENKPQIDHIDTNPSNNRASNLRWTTQSENLLNEITRKKISANTTRQMANIENRRKISIANSQWKRTEEMRNKMSKSHKGVPLSESHRASIKRIAKEKCAIFKKSILQLSIDGKVIQEWDSLTEASETVGVCISGISLCVHGKQEVAGGYKWKFNTLKEDSYESNTNEPKAAMVQ